MGDACYPTRAIPALLEEYPVLTVDLRAVQRNYRALSRRIGQTECAAVVKADAYGLGAVPLAKALYETGCRSFFVATIEEGVEIRAALMQEDVTIYILFGPHLRDVAAIRAFALTPVLSSLEQIAIWRQEATIHAKPLPAALQLDTGMNRLGLSETDLATLQADATLLSGIDLTLVMSHLACPDTPENARNLLQQRRFERMIAGFPGVRKSLANSAGMFLGDHTHFDMVRPGAALYGINPTPQHHSPVETVAVLTAPILQLRDLPADEAVGYGATYSSDTPRRLAIVAAGYADGYFRALGNTGKAWVAGYHVPLVGRGSMDLVTLDVTEVPTDLLRPGTAVELIGPHCPADLLASQIGTVAYELLTRLGGRVQKRYVG
jgi:alanine racemase